MQSIRDVQPIITRQSQHHSETISTKTRLQEVADDLLGFFEKIIRNDGTEIWVLKDNAPAHLREIVRKAHADYLPDDWRYRFIFEALCALAETEDADEISMEPDIYTGQLLTWLLSNISRTEYVDETVRDVGHGEGIVQDIQLGQQREKEEVLGVVRDELANLLK